VSTYVGAVLAKNRLTHLLLEQKRGVGRLPNNLKRSGRNRVSDSPPRASAGMR
jgi:hypothetical protein